MSIVSDILQLVESVDQIIETKGMALLDEKNGFASLVTSQLDGFVSENFQQSLEIFNTMKGSIETLRGDGSNYLSNLYQ